MIDRLRPWVAPAYLFACLLLGGSAQGVWGNTVLRLLAIAIIAWAVLGRRDQPLPRAIGQLLVLASLTVALALAQLVPLPVAWWAALPGHGQLLAGFHLLGVEPGFLPLSLAPYETIGAVLALLPAFGMLAAMIGLTGYSNFWLAAALVAGTVAGVLLGILQVTSADPVSSPWYPYELSNFGVATGFFANSNHMASLLLVTIAFIAALGVSVRTQAKDVRLRWAAMALVGGGLVVTVLGLVLNGSLAGYGLGLPVVAASLLMLWGVGKALARSGLVLVGIGCAVALALLWASPVTRGADTSVSSRQDIFRHSFQLVRQFAPTGTGLGTFDRAYRLTEDPRRVDRYYVNHAHNDYLELAVETGIPGMLLLLAFLMWWGRSVLQMLRSPDSDEFAIAAAIASAALLVHSLVDYPLRTAAMSAVFTMCLALIVQSRRTSESDNDLRPVRHIVVE